MTGATGPQGPQGEQGPIGPQGENGTVLSYADFYALMPPDNEAVIAAGEDVAFPRNGAIANTDIGRIDDTTFLLAEIGTYLITFNVPIIESGQLTLTLNGVDFPYAVFGRATGTSNIIGTTLLTTTEANSTITIRNPVVNDTELTVTPESGGSLPVSAHLTILRLA